MFLDNSAMSLGNRRRSDHPDLRGRRARRRTFAAWNTIGLTTLVLAACATVPTGLDVTLTLDSVRRPQEVGDYTLVPADSSGFEYADRFLAMAIVPLAGSFTAVIENRTDRSMSLLWADATYVGPTGRSSGVVLGGAQQLRLDEVPGAQVLASHTRAAVSIVPQTNIRRGNVFVPGFYAVTAGCDAVRGTHLRLVLPIEVEDGSIVYTLTFVPTAAAIARWKTDPHPGEPVVQSQVLCPPLHDPGSGRP